MSGAPKIRAMQIIADLEGTTRGPYASCVRLFQLQRPDGTGGNGGNRGRLNQPKTPASADPLLIQAKVSLRSKSPLPPFAPVESGGGWVNDSEPESEFQETVNQCKAMLKAVVLAERLAKA